MNLSANQNGGELLYTGFNQDSTCFAAGMDNGFIIYNSNPFKRTFHRVFKGGISHVEMLYRSNIVALVGGGKNPHFLPNKVMIWDDNACRCIGELTYRSQVGAVRLRRDLIAVILCEGVYVYNFKSLELRIKIDTYSNPKSLCAFSSIDSAAVLACPGIRPGHVRVEFYGANKTMLVEAHDSPLACIALNADGTRLATASENGTLIRIFDLITGLCINEFRRGSTRAEIYSIAFDLTNTFLACSSDTGTIHVFSLASSTMTSKGNQTSTLSFLGGFVPYFLSEWSFSQYYIMSARLIVSFCPDMPHTLVALSADGLYYKLSFNPDKPGEWIEDKIETFANHPVAD